MNDSAPEGIAIIGMSGRFPGARNIAEFWQNLLAGRDTIHTIDGASTAAADPNYIPRRGLLERPEWFDAAFFGISPREAEVIDPQQRVFLEECWSALEDAACDPQRFSGAIGVFAGMSNNTYWANNVVHHPELIANIGALTAMMGNEKDYLATRVAYKLNLRGPALNIYTACSTSLVAVCQAVQGLLNHTCDVAISGGISITFPHARGYVYDEGGILSPDGHCRAFDATSAGTVFSNGVGVVILKRYADALADGDRVYAVIRGAALNNDGSSKVSFTAPSVDGHAEVIAFAHALASIEPRSIGYVEAHGTGTPLGDPIEIAGLTAAFRAFTEDKQFCAIGSAKTNIGHLDAAAGVAGLIKAALAVYHGKIPPSCHFTSANPALQLEASPFFVADRVLDWPHGPRRCGVSSFGVGGTNAHVVLEQGVARPTPSENLLTTSDRPQVFILSAKTESALAQRASDLADHVANDPDFEFESSAWTTQTGRAEFEFRRAFVASSREVLISGLRGFEPKRTFAGRANRNASVVFMFPGQGSQYAGMGARLYRSEPAFRAAVDECSAILQPELGLDLREVLFSTPNANRPGNDLLRQTRITQPAIFVVSYALAQMWRALGIQPAAMIGHSIGEYVAATLAGVFTLPDAVRLVAQRAKLVSEQPTGAMLAVRLGENDARQFLSSDVSLAAVNSPRLVVLAGPDAAISSTEARLSAEAIASKRLDTSHAFHSSMMDLVVGPLEDLAAGIERNAPSIPILSTVSGTWLEAVQAVDPGYWARHAREPVSFSNAIAKLLESEHQLFLECGPGTTLTQLTRQHQAASRLILSSLQEGSDERITTLSALAQLWTNGAEIRWECLYSHGKPERVSLPSYPFERNRYFVDAPAAPAAASLPIPPTPESIITPQAAQPTAPAPDPTSIATPQPKSDEPRDVQLTQAILAELESFSGMDLSSADPAVSFVELGFDSLSLTQAAIALYRRFRVKVTFRQLLQDLPSPLLLAQFLDANLPAEEPAISIITSPAESAPLTAPAPAHGPFRGIDRSAAAITDEQNAALADLISRYAARTAGSKTFTDQHRSHLADPRAVAGFRREWKEIVYPLICERSEGARLWDIDNNEYIDVTLGFGQILFGHRPAWLIEALERQLHTGFEIGPTSPLAGTLAERLSRFLGLERVAFCNTGSEAVAAALRIARTVTGRDRVAVFSGAYHGIFDEVLFRPGPAPIAPGIPAAAVQNLIVLEYNSDEALAWLREHSHELAAVMVEPVQSRHPALVPHGFLHEIRQLTAATETSLIFDEIVTGFRVAPRGAQEFFGIVPDIATYGKVIGGGLPIGVVAGRKLFMDALDGGEWRYGDDSFPEAGVTFFAGTFVRHPLALAAAGAVLDQLEAKGPAVQETLAGHAAGLTARMNSHLERCELPLRWENFSSFYHLPLAPELRFAPLIFPQLRLRGIHAWENRPCFLSAAHTPADIARVAQAFEESVNELITAGLLPGKVAPPLTELAAEITLHPAAHLTSQLTDPGFALTESQREIFIAAVLSDEANTAFNDTISLRIQGSVDPARFENCLAQIVARHESLRTTFSAGGERQIVRPNISPLPFTFEDLSHLAAEPRSHAIHARIQEDATTPFDLQTGPLFRARLLQFGPDAHEFVFTAHHVICDGWSFGLIAGELSQIYSARSAKNVALPSALPFRAYARAQSHVQQTPAAAEAEQWWLQQFASPPPALELPTDHPRPHRRTFNGATRTILLPDTLCDQIRKVAAAHRCTSFSAQLAAFFTLLHRLTGQTDLVTGIAAAGQTQVERPLVGHCVNFLPIRVQTESDAPFANLLSLVNASVLDAHERQDITFGKLLQNISVPRDPGRIPLVSVSFNVDRAPGQLDFDGAPATFQPVAKHRYHLELSFNLIEEAGGARLFCNFNRDLFAPETIDRWLTHYRTLLESIAADPHSAVCQLPLLRPDEQRHLLIDWNATKRPYPRDTGLDQLFESIVAAHQGAIAVIDGDQHLTYEQLNLRANVLANRLLNSELTPGSLVGICLERSIEFVVAALAIIKCGCAYVPLDPSWPAERLQFMARDSSFATVITLLKHSRHFGGRTTLMDGPRPLQDTGDSNPEIPTDGSIPAYVIYTSGSTGEPKGVVVSHRAVARLVLNTDYLQLTPKETVGHASNTAFDAATFEIWGALLNGARLVILRNTTVLDPVKLHAAIEHEGITVLFVTTALFNQVAAITPDAFRPLRHLLFGGEMCSRAAIRRVIEAGPPRRLLHVYGPTESTTFATCYEIIAAPKDDTPVPIGHPIANTTAYILDARLQPVPIGVTGEIYLGKDGLAIGYLQRPDLTAEHFIESPFKPDERLYRTGDLARWLPDGTIEILGRWDDQIKIRGFRVELGEIEAELSRHPGILESTVTLITNGSDDHHHHALAAYFVPRDTQPPAAADLRAYLRRRLPDYMVPQAFVRLEQLPLNANGKVDRHALPPPEVDDRPLDLEPRNPTEQRIAGLMAATLGLPSVGLNDDFFQLGGHSLLAMDLLARIRKSFGVEVPASRLFETPHVAGLADYITTRAASIETPTPSQIAQQTRSFRFLVPIQKGAPRQRPLFLVPGGWGGEIEFLVYAQIARHLGPEIPIYGLKARGAGTAEPPHESVAAMAADYLREIRTLQPVGPYILAGECVGGICAHEIACQLRDCGETIQRLILLDTSVPSPDELSDYLSREERKRAAEQSFQPSGVRKHVQKILGATLTNKVRNLFGKSTPSSPPPGGVAELEQHPRGQSAYPPTMMRHALRSYAGRVTLLVDEESFNLYGNLGWDAARIGDLETHVLPGDHLSYIRDHSETAARKLHELLRENSRES